MAITGMYNDMCTKHMSPAWLSGYFDPNCYLGLEPEKLTLDCGWQCVIVILDQNNIPWSLSIAIVMHDNWINRNKKA